MQEIERNITDSTAKLSDVASTCKVRHKDKGKGTVVIINSAQLRAS